MEHIDSIQKSPEDPQSFLDEDLLDKMMPQSRMDEDTQLIHILKLRADELIVRYQALQKINTELEDKVALCNTELDHERSRSALLEERFTTLASNNQSIISFMEEHKEQNVKLRQENNRLQSENNSLFSQKLHRGELLIQNLKEEIKMLREKLTNNENEHREKLSESESKLQEQAAQHKVKEASLLTQYHDARQQHADAVEMSKDLKLKLEEAQEQLALKELNFKESITNLTKENDKLLNLTMERGKVIQEKQKQIQQLETRWRDEKKTRIEAQDRFELEAEAVNADLRVKSLESALAESTKKLHKFVEDCDAFKEHSGNLLKQERELTKRLCDLKM
ncbi:coiled-coil domain-containing protein 89 [Cololabis saira]|uniref:coiled-coil domain-containing protein 89 n=1 Tax=Cololabis saira TaxID=129043 RepID=UPI002AD59B96|nr:coiled-coil domain-containing protein 89 [Cololabis saira]